MEFWRFVDPGSGAGPLLSGTYNPYLVVLSLGLSCLAGIAALRIADRIEASRKGAVRGAWLLAGAVAMGAGIWSMHFTGMLAFSLPVPMTYDVGMTLFSLAPAVLGSGAALYFLTLPGLKLWDARLQLGALLMAAGIGTMHYTGMEAMRMPAQLHYDFKYFVLSLVVAHLLAMVAIYTRFAIKRMYIVPSMLAPLIGGVIMGHAVAGMHYTAMYAASFYTFPELEYTPGGLSHSVMTRTITEFTFVLLLLTILAVWYDNIRQLTRRQATMDVLTSLPNRAALEAHLSKEIAYRAEKPGSLALIILGLDKFTEINNSLGHITGDELLKTIARRLQDNAQGHCFIARFAGDEFAVAISEDSSHGKEMIAVTRRLLDIVQWPIIIHGLNLHMEASAGITAYDGSDKNLDAHGLIRQAHNAMRTAKEENRRYLLFSEELEERAQERLWLSTELHKALDNELLELYYQPQVNLISGKLLGFEALIRWNHPEQGWISPQRFIPIAESRGLNIRLDDFVINQACQQCRDWLQSGLEFGYVAVNLSPPYFEQAEAAGKLARMLGQNRIPSRCLQLEITEARLIDFGMELKKRLLQIRSLGLALVIDDFGTGYSSLSYLKELPVDKLKLDQSFVKELSDDLQSRAIPDAVVGMARGLGIALIAEGVETEQQRAALIRLGYREGQGYLFSRALPAQEVPGFIAACERQDENISPSISS